MHRSRRVLIALVFVAVTAALAANQRQGAPPAPPLTPGRGGGAGTSAGSADKHVVDPAAADRGRTVYAAECITCHGTQARGTDNGANLVYSVLVLHDRYGSELGPFLKKGHPTQSGKASASFNEAQLADLSHFIHQRVYETLRSSPTFVVQNVLTGDREAGAKYFNGEGRCATCHSPTGDLKGIGSRYEPPALQQRFMFPRSGRGAKPATVTVTPLLSDTVLQNQEVIDASGQRRVQPVRTYMERGGAPISGTLIAMDDFTVSLRDAAGQYHSFKRSPALKVVKNDPYAAHIELLNRITDQNMHDIVAYLEKLK